MESIVMTSNKRVKKRIDCSLIEVYNDGLEEDKSPNLLNSISALLAYKSKELHFVRVHRINVASLNTLIVLVTEWFDNNIKLTIDGLLNRHCYSKGYYRLVYERLETLYKRGLVDCDKVYRSNGNVNYYYPTEIGVKAVLGLLD